jgi:tRNA A37 methylthiotransferase MiaB
MADRVLTTIEEATNHLTAQIGDVLQRLEAVEIAVTGCTGCTQSENDAIRSGGVIGWMNAEIERADYARNCLGRIEAVLFGNKPKETPCPKGQSPAGKRSR